MSHFYSLVILFIALLALPASAVQIFYEDFEDPIIDGTVTNTPSGWVSLTGSNAGLSDGAAVGKTGDQFGWVHRDGGTLSISDIGHVLGAGTNYTLTCDLTFSRIEATYATVELLAGGVVIAASTNICTSDDNFDNQAQVSMSVIALPGHPQLGQPLGIRLSGDYWHAYFDDLVLDASPTTNDFTAPTPTNVVWNQLPPATVSNSIILQAVAVTDANPVQYYFENLSSGNNSGWQSSPFWTDMGLEPRSNYTYRFKARDMSVNLNETDWSTQESVMCEEHIIAYQSFEGPSILPNTYLSFGDTKWFMPPAGWAGGGASSRAVIHDTSASWPVETPFGEQWLGMRGETYIETTSALSNRVLEVGYTYRVTYHTGCAGERAGEEDGVPGDNRVDLMAGTEGVTFFPLGNFELKGIPGKWPLFRVEV